MVCLVRHIYFHSRWTFNWNNSFFIQSITSLLLPLSSIGRSDLVIETNNFFQRNYLFYVGRIAVDGAISTMGIIIWMEIDSIFAQKIFLFLQLIPVQVNVVFNTRITMNNDFKLFDLDDMHEIQDRIARAAFCRK